MRSPSALSTTLMLSLLIILAGVMFIVFIQFDRGYKLPNSSSDYHQQQNNLITNLYQGQNQTIASERTDTVTPERQQTQKLSPQTGYRDVINPPYSSQWNHSGQQEYEAMYQLRNNPWSPYYQPAQ